MHYFIFASKDSYITEDSSGQVILYPDYTDRNYGADEIIELKKEFANSYSTASYNVSRMLTQFDYTDVSASIVDGTITSPKYYLRYYEVEGQSESDKTYSLSSFPISQSWEEGVGKHFDNPKTKKGVTWTDYNSGSAWSLVADTNADSGSRTTGGGVWITGSGYEASQSFTNQSGDMEMDVTDIVNNHLGSLPNYGFITKFSGSYEDDGTPLHLKFFSKNTHTIYAPKLEVRWNDISFSTGSLNSLTMSGEFENHIFIKGLQPTYRESEKIRFRLGCRKKYVQKTFTESVQNATGSYVPSGRGLYSIVDVATDTPRVPFSAYTSMSCDSNSMYFDQRFNTFEPGRYYKVLFKLKYDDGQEIIYDNDEEFKVI
jgi:hypothetical protein|tara:strand:+ start:12574 stop:13689 length:1116 start_codon:yes stop_codon:yes gene_type:complete